ncbi:MAG: hypothetical protein M3N95_17350 [Actinomycetota bacterium]|nr:hypothetical protein [Actinomycetota bacterium]
MTTSSMPSVEASLSSIAELADAVLFEGYILYPYRANDPKNRVRWQFGVLAPPGYVALDPSERSVLQTECLLEGSQRAITVRVRLLHVQRRIVQRAEGDHFVPTEALDVGEATYLPWDEAVVHESTANFQFPEGPADDVENAIDIHVPGATETTLLHTPESQDCESRIAGRLVRERLPLDAHLSLCVRALPGPYGVRQLRLRLENRTPWAPRGSTEPDRPDALRKALVAAHLVVSVTGGAFISLIDTPEWAKGYAELCEQIGAFPVLAGPVGDRSLVLASPIILYDHPQVAPESASQFCDATEMDEMLTLRTLTLTEEEKRMVRGSDPRAAALVDQIDNLPPELMDRLHGAIRSMTAVARPVRPAPQPWPAQRPDEIPPWLNAEVDASFDPETDVVVVQGVPLTRGASVRLRPGARRADAQDMFLAGRNATVQAVLSDLDGAQHLAVSLDDLDEDGFNPHGRFLYFAPDEVEPLGVTG